MQKTLVWFRQDLRLHDNAALRYAAEAGSVLPVFILEDDAEEEAQPGEASRWWLHQSLLALNESLDGKLVCRRGDALSHLLELVEECEIDAVVWNRRYLADQIERDTATKQALKDKGLAVKSFQGDMLWEPWTIKTQQDTPYKVFTPFYNKGCLKAEPPAEPIAAPLKIISYVRKRPEGEPTDLKLLPEHPWHEKLREHWEPGERGAMQRLEAFLEGPVENYKEGRDFPAMESVSRLSPHLHFGEVSPRTVWQKAKQAAVSSRRETEVEHFLRELGWREFSYYLLFHFPQITRENLQAKFDEFPWRRDTEALKAWQKGQTGYPIVDAGMRELWQTGYMHNRVRMIVGSFLVKNLLIHWHEGADWFFDCLVDADVANNSASWQWVAGSGADASPFFRIFNPVTQSEKFDPDGEYLRRFVPELKALPDKYLHDPGNAPTDVLRKAGVTLGDTYPKPLVELKGSRQRALNAYDKIKKS